MCIHMFAKMSFRFEFEPAQITFQWPRIVVKECYVRLQATGNSERFATVFALIRFNFQHFLQVYLQDMVSQDTHFCLPNITVNALQLRNTFVQPLMLNEQIFLYDIQVAYCA